MKYIFSLSLLLFQGQLLFSQGFNSFWSSVNEKTVGEKTSELLTPDQYSLVRLNSYQSSFEYLLNAPDRGIVSEDDFVFTLPFPDGVNQEFSVRNTPIMAPELARKFPEIKTYTLTDIAKKGYVAKIDFGPHGFHAMIRIPGQSPIFICPWRLEDQIYMVFRKSSYPQPVESFYCQTEYENLNLGQLRQAGDCGFRQYRLALACTGEYGQFHGGSVASAMAAMVTTMNRVNGVYEQDASITMQIVANNNSIIYTNGLTDPYTNNSGFAMLGENQTNCDNVIGSGNYDIGHVFSTGGGGVASLGVPCVNGSKARGVTGSGSPVGDPFDIDYVAHEMGHQYGANHTFNNSCGGNRNSSTAYEPGSASTIMGYAGICNPNVQNNSDAYFHAISLDEMGDYVSNDDGDNCDILLSSANNAPTVSAGSDYTIPISTPFKLTAIASDTDGNPLTYCWEQYNREISSQPPSPTSINGPNFRSLTPVSENFREFPADGIGSTWEVLPSVSRSMDFRVTVRDYNSTYGYGCTDEDDMEVTFTASAGPFTVSSPNGGENWTAGGMETVTWNVANTNGSPVNTTSVNILLSTDGGTTYPHVLATATPNDGSQSVTMPAINSITCRIKVEASGNIFFDNSDDNFELGAGGGAQTCSTYVSTDVPVAISSSGTPTVFSDITVTDTDQILDAEVELIIGTHTWVSDLDITLIHPDATEVDLIFDECSSQNDFNMGFIDGGASVSCPLDQGIDYDPIDPLANFVSKTANGVWRLKIYDDTNNDGGELTGWSLKLCYSASAGCPPSLTLDSGTISSGTYEAGASITASVEVDAAANVLFRAPEINLNGDFMVPIGAEFTTDTVGCQ